MGQNEKGSAGRGTDAGVGLYDGSQPTEEGEVTSRGVVEIDVPLLEVGNLLLDRGGRFGECLVHPRVCSRKHQAGGGKQNAFPNFVSC